MTMSAAPGGSPSGTDAPPVPGDPTALVSAMQPPKGSSDQSGRFFAWGTGPATFTWTLTVDGQGQASTTTQRTFGDPKARVVQLTQAANGLAGTYETVPDGQRHAAVLALGGSEGGAPVGLAAALAARGIPTLAQAYFKAPGLPDTLSKIPLETFDQGLAWLRSQPDVDPNRIWVQGGSRGSEAALLVATLHPDLVHGVLVASPSNVALGDVPPTGASAWTLGGQPVPFTAEHNTPAPTDVPDAVIAAEKVNGPVIAVCGGQDTLWSSCRYGQAIIARLDGAKDPHPHQLWTYPQAGHLVDVLLPYQPLRLDAYQYGVSPEADAQARADLWPKVVAAVTATTG